MRGILAGLIVALFIVVIALFVATLGALGVAAIGWLLHHWFDLTQWQGSLIALVVAIAVGFIASRMSAFVRRPASRSGSSGMTRWTTRTTR